MSEPLSTNLEHAALICEDENSLFSSKPICRVLSRIGKPLPNLSRMVSACFSNALRISFSIIS